MNGQKIFPLKFRHGDRRIGAGDKRIFFFNKRTEGRVKNEA